MLLASPMGQFHKCCLTTSQTQAPPVAKPKASVTEMDHQFRIDAATIRADSSGIAPTSSGRSPKQICFVGAADELFCGAGLCRVRSNQFRQQGIGHAAKCSARLCRAKKSPPEKAGWVGK